LMLSLVDTSVPSPRTILLDACIIEWQTACIDHSLLKFIDGHFLQLQ